MIGPDAWSYDEWPSNMIVVVPCSGSKLEHPAPARELYTGSLFRLALRAARRLVDDDWIRILSARHGLVELERELEPYDTTWGDDDAIDALDLHRQVRRHRLELEPSFFVSLCPGAYTGWLRSCVPGDKLLTPLDGSRGIGEMRGRLSFIAGRVS